MFRKCHADAVTNRIQESPEYGDTSFALGNLTAFTSQQFLLLREHLNTSGNVGYYHAYISCRVMMGSWLEFWAARIVRWAELVGPVELLLF